MKGNYNIEKIVNKVTYGMTLSEGVEYINNLSKDLKLEVDEELSKKIVRYIGKRKKALGIK